MISRIEASLGASRTVLDTWDDSEPLAVTPNITSTTPAMATEKPSGFLMMGSFEEVAGGEPPLVERDGQQRHGHRPGA
jgi:hypothetical protein